MSTWEYVAAILIGAAVVLWFIWGGPRDDR